MRWAVSRSGGLDPRGVPAVTNEDRSTCGASTGSDELEIEPIGDDTPVERVEKIVRLYMLVILGGATVAALTRGLRKMLKVSLEWKKDLARALSGHEMKSILKQTQKEAHDAMPPDGPFCEAEPMYYNVNTRGRGEGRGRGRGRGRPTGRPQNAVVHALFDEPSPSTPAIPSEVILDMVGLYSMIPMELPSRPADAKPRRDVKAVCLSYGSAIGDGYMSDMPGPSTQNVGFMQHTTCGDTSNYFFSHANEMFDVSTSGGSLETLLGYARPASSGVHVETHLNIMLDHGKRTYVTLGISRKIYQCPYKNSKLNQMSMVFKGNNIVKGVFEKYTKLESKKLHCLRPDAETRIMHDSEHDKIGHKESLGGSPKTAQLDSSSLPASTCQAKQIGQDDILPTWAGPPIDTEIDGSSSVVSSPGEDEFIMVDAHIADPPRTKVPVMKAKKKKRKEILPTKSRKDGDGFRPFDALRKPKGCGTYTYNSFWLIFWPGKSTNSLWCFLYWYQLLPVMETFLLADLLAWKTKKNETPSSLLLFSMLMLPQFGARRRAPNGAALEILVEHRITDFPVIDDNWKLVSSDLQFKQLNPV
ncbi:hypothetical protein FXO37_19198 [Capsicum annuum]|nr:hypothetical protein FXO37_19198 [Capsicum annuum]